MDLFKEFLVLPKNVKAVTTCMKINYIMDHTPLSIFWFHWTKMLLNASIHLTNINYVFFLSSTYNLHHKHELEFIPIFWYEKLPISQQVIIEITFQIFVSPKPVRGCCTAKKRK